MVEATSLAQADSFVQLVSSSKGTEVVHMLKKLASDHTSKELGVKPDDIFAGHIEQGLVKPGEVIGEKGRMGMRTPLTSCLLVRDQHQDQGPLKDRGIVSRQFPPQQVLSDFSAPKKLRFSGLHHAKGHEGRQPGKIN